MPADNVFLPQRLLHITTELIIFFLILFSPLILGGVLILPVSILQCLSFLLLFVYIFVTFLKKDISIIKTNYLPLFIFLGLVIFQLLPLGSTLLSFLSGATSDLYRNFSPSLDGFLSVSIYREATVKQLLELLSYLAVFFVVLNYFDTEKKQRRLLLCIIFSGFIYAFYGVISKLYAPESAFSTFSNRNHFAAYMLLTAPLAIALASVSSSLAKRIIFSFMSSVMVVGIFLSQSRAGRICFLFSLAIFVILLQVKKKTKKALPVFSILLIFLFLFIMLIGAPFFLQRLETVLTPLKAYSERLNILQDSLYIIADFPVFGTGLGTYGEIIQKYKTTEWQVSYAFAHNEPIQLLSETGLIGFASMFLFMFLYIYSVFIVWFKRREPYASYMTLGCIISISAFILHSLLDFVFHVPADALLFFIILALAFRTVYLKHEQNLLPVPKFEISLSAPARGAVIGAIFLSLCFFESLVWRRYQAETIFQDNKKEGLSFRNPLREIDMAIELNSLKADYYIRRADLLVGAAADEGHLSQPLLMAKRDYLHSVSLNPVRADYHLRLGWIYGMLDDSESEEKEFKKAILLDPKNRDIESYVEK